jgi:Tfp pilus assembly protein PilF
LGNYAVFLETVRKDYDAAEEKYKQALEANPKHVTNLSNFALFLVNVRKDHMAAEALRKRASEVQMP